MKTIDLRSDTITHPTDEISSTAIDEALLRIKRGVEKAV
jgi:hypothetical protein